MQEIITTLGIGLAMAAASPFVAEWAAKRIDAWRKRDAYARLMADPHIQIGARCRAIYIDDRDAPLVPPCTITGLAVGRMVVRIDDPAHPDHGCLHTFTGREFERLHPRIEPPAA